MTLHYLNQNDYLSINTLESLEGMTRGSEQVLAQAEEAAEVCFIDYLSDNYEIEKELNKGKYIAQYDRAILFPVGVHFYLNGEIYKAIQTINSHKAPTISPYWELYLPTNPQQDIKVSQFSQFSTYKEDDLVFFNEDIYRCLKPCGFDFMDIRIPGITAWEKVSVEEWQPVEYELWKVVKFNSIYYTLISLEDFDNNIDPEHSDNWGEISEYDPEHNTYELSDHEYVVYQDNVFYPMMDVNSDEPQPVVNMVKSDPRNQSIVKHMVRIATYELSKRVAAANVGVFRINDYNDSIKWLKDAGKLALNPRIPRKLDANNEEILDWQMAEYRVKADPYASDWIS